MSPVCLFEQTFQGDETKAHQIQYVSARGCGGARSYGGSQAGKKDVKYSGATRAHWGQTLRPDVLSKRGKLDVYIFPEIVDDEPLFVVSQYGSHHVFVPIVFLP